MKYIIFNFRKLPVLLITHDVFLISCTTNHIKISEKIIKLGTIKNVFKSVDKRTIYTILII